MLTIIRRMLVLITLYFVVFGVYAAHPLISEDNGTQGTSGNQIEVNSDFSTKSSINSRTAAFTYTYGVTDTLDIFFNTPNTWGATCAPCIKEMPQWRVIPPFLTEPRSRVN